MSNIEQILPQLQSISTTGSSYLIRAVVKIQTHVRKWLAKLVYVNRSTTKYWRFLSAKRVTQSLKCYRLVVDDYYKDNAAKVLTMRYLLERTLMKGDVEAEKESAANAGFDVALNSPEAVARQVVTDGEYVNEYANNILLVHIPGINAIEQIRINIANVAALQNADVACFHQLANPQVSMLYIVATPVTTLELNYHEKLFQMLELPSDSINRIHFITPGIYLYILYMYLFYLCIYIYIYIYIYTVYTYTIFTIYTLYLHTIHNIYTLYTI